MENLFFNLSSFEELKLNLFEKFHHEKIFLITKNKNLHLELQKNHLIETDFSNLKSESLKCAVVDFDKSLIDKIKKHNFKKPIYIILNSVNDFFALNLNGLKCFLIFNPLAVLDSFSLAKKQIFDFCQKCTFSLSSELFKNVFNLNDYNFRFEIETICKTIKFFNDNNRIDFYNYFEFSNLLKKLYVLKNRVNFNFFEKIKHAYNLIGKQNCSDNAFCFMLNFVEMEFLKNKNFISLPADSFIERCKNCENRSAEKMNFLFKSYLNRKKYAKVIEKNYVFVFKMMQKFFLLSLMLAGHDSCGNFNSNIFFKAINFAVDFEDGNIFQFMKNMGQLNAN